MATTRWSRIRNSFLPRTRTDMSSPSDSALPMKVSKHSPLSCIRWLKRCRSYVILTESIHIFQIHPRFVECFTCPPPDRNNGKHCTMHSRCMSLKQLLVFPRSLPADLQLAHSCPSDWSRNRCQFLDFVSSLCSAGLLVCLQCHYWLYQTDLNATE